MDLLPRGEQRRLLLNSIEAQSTSHTMKTYVDYRIPYFYLLHGSQLLWSVSHLVGIIGGLYSDNISAGDLLFTEIQENTQPRRIDSWRS